MGWTSEFLEITETSLAKHIHVHVTRYSYFSSLDIIDERKNFHQPT